MEIQSGKIQNNIYILSLYLYILNFPVLLSAAFPRLHDRIINLIAGILITKTDDKK